jgi:hypothetical protein
LQAHDALISNPGRLSSEPEVRDRLKGAGVVRWRRKIGQAVKVGSTMEVDGPDDWEAEAVFG